MAQAVTTDTPSPFLAKLLAPLSVPIERRRFEAEVRREAEDIWSMAYHRYEAALRYREYCAHNRIVAEIAVRRPLTCKDTWGDQLGRYEEAVAHKGLVEAVDEIMKIPAPNMAALRLKEKLRDFDKGRKRWTLAILLDQKRLKEAK